ncbi:MAG TPA: cupin domain-containing protein [Ktedonobacteraceae bacterium]|nr:cupin domain-containing protein [Ktedonobacteraceae bacterium]
MATAETDMQTALNAFYADVAAEDLQPLWTQTRNLMTAHPVPASLPWLWRWDKLKALAERAMQLITVERGGERRVLSLSNPGLGGLPFATPTLWGAIQCLNPHERAPAHRHSPGALRFVIEGDSVWTTVNGDACDMHPGDLILTPSWTWHDHCNNGDQPMLWFDGLDIPTIVALDAMFFEEYDDMQQEVKGPHNLSEQAFAGRGVLPLDTGSHTKHSPLLVYRRADMVASLDALLALRGGPIASIEFVNPTTGKSVMPTMGCEMHRIVPGGHTKPYRKVGGSIFVVFQGSGYSVINGQRFDWSRGDMFVVPSWAIAEHIAIEQADLFAVTDRPIMQALELFREQYLDQPQQISGHFSAK